MTEQKRHSIIKSAGFALGLLLLISLTVTALLYFEIVGTTLAGRLLYGGFIAVLFITSLIASKIVGKKGLFVGAGVGLAFIALTALYRFIGVEVGLNLAFLIRSAIVLLVSGFGGIVGVNTSK